jgi:pyridoxine 4-dehydrogenase
LSTLSDPARTITIGKDSGFPLEVNRLGYGTMRLTGPQIWGEPQNRPEALQILKTAVRSGVQFLDTADYYGQDITNRLICEALYPYPSGLVICTKVGATRRPDRSWVSFASPKELAISIDNNLRTLRLERLDLVHLRLMVPHPVPLEESLDAMFELQKKGKILHVGLSNASPEDLESGLKKGPIATVENAYGYHQRKTSNAGFGTHQGGEEVLPMCEQYGIPLIPFFSLLHSLPANLEKISRMAGKYACTPAQLLISWLLHRSDWILPIPGTSRLSHFEENQEAFRLRLSHEDMDLLG